METVKLNNGIHMPKYTNKERMIENLNVFDFSLSNDDMQARASLDQHKTLFMSPDDPEMVRFILNIDKNNET
ncbi:MAG: hypothetical protein JKX79_10500 [Labilibaculum sp.]|nr:hypothetical protein [Labilibaculum sp.]